MTFFVFFGTGNALSAAALVLEALAEVDARFVKVADKECDAASSDLKKWFKKLAVSPLPVEHFNTIFLRINTLLWGYGMCRKTRKHTMIVLRRPMRRLNKLVRFRVPCFIIG